MRRGQRLIHTGVTLQRATCTFVCDLATIVARQKFSAVCVHLLKVAYIFT